jgi:predicted dehydrogenase
MKIKIGIIGYGKIGQARHKILKEFKDIAKIVHIVDKKKLNIRKVKCSTNYKDVIKDPKINTVFICTPNYLNHKITIECLKAKKNIFCEKPPTITLSQMKRVIKYEKKYKTKLIYGFNHREHESIEDMKKIINKKQFGKILWMRGRYGKSVNDDFFSDWRSKKKYAGGGILMDQGIHMLDLFLYLAGDFNKIKSSLSNLYWKGDVEDNAFIILENTKTKVSASLHSTMTQWRHIFSLEIFLEKGYLVLNGLKTSSNLYGNEILTIAKNRSGTPVVNWKNEKQKEYKYDDSFKKEIAYFLNAIIKDKKIEKNNSKDALKLMSVLNKIYKK